MSAKSEDVEGAIKWAEAEMARRNDAIIPAPTIESAVAHGLAANQLRTLLASHAAQAEEIAAQSRLITDQDAGLAKYEARIASLEAGLEKARVAIACYSPDPTEPLEEIDALLSGKASA
jgi:hypothetical protein